MNPFVLAWNASEQTRAAALSALRDLTSVYSQLDPATLWSHEAGPLFLASMHSPGSALGRRVYAHRDEEAITLFEGTPVDRTGTLVACDAGQLSAPAHWASLPDRLEGQFVVARATMNPGTLELMTDPLGMEQVYFLELDGAWIVSTNAGLLARIGRETSFDSLGASSFLTLGWTVGDRTLRPGIRVVPGGQLWRWEAGSPDPRRTDYYPRKTVPAPARVTARSAAAGREGTGLCRTNGGEFSGAGGIARLAESLSSLCRTVARDYGPLDCPITGGKDSRLLAALLLHSGTTASYYTSGDPGSGEVRIARSIADRFHLTHRISAETSEQIIDAWDEISARLVAQNDGLISLWQAPDVINQPSRVDSLTTSLWGAAGEIARGHYSTPMALLRPSMKRTQELLGSLVRPHGGLVRSEAIEETLRYMRGFAGDAGDAGFAPIDVPDLFYAHERVRRWAGSNARKNKPISDLFTPFTSRSFMEAAFSISAQHRYAEALHYGLLRHLSPELHRMPFANDAWPDQRPVVGLAAEWLSTTVMSQGRRAAGRLKRTLFPRQVRRAAAARSFDHSSWLEAKRARIREMCLDQSGSRLWDFVDRSTFERASDSTISQEQRKPFLLGLYHVATLFQFARLV